jgi:superfamily I DNA/RNA helicase
MARLLPSKRIGTISPETAKVLHALSRIPGDEYLVWTSLPVTESARPELMLLHEERSCWLISISAVSEFRIESAVQGALFSPDQDSLVHASDLGVAERRLLDDFYTLVLEEAGIADPSRISVHKVIAFPNAPQALLDQVAELGGISGFVLWGREMIRSDALMAEIAAVERGLLPARLVHCLRRRFTPESVIPEAFVPRVERTASRRLTPELRGFLLDLDQEWLVKDDLLSPEAVSALENFRLRLVTGVAGSGKSLVLLYRAMLQAKFNPGARILVLTHNRPLHGELQERFRRLCPNARIEWNTYFKWCWRLQGPMQVVSQRDRETLVDNLSHDDKRLARLPVAFLLSEIDWMQDNAITRRARYLGAVRTGRKRPLSDEQRQALFELFEKYEAELDRRRMHDWNGVALELWRKVKLGYLTPPQYEFVFVDEAQFFAPTWFGVLKRAVRAGVGQLFLAADPTQGFLKRRQSWITSGLDVRGRAVRLRRSYRNTRAILEFAARFYRTRLPEEDEDINLPDARDLALLEPGPAPELLQVTAGFDEILRVRNEIIAAIEKGANPEHFLVIHAEWAMARTLVSLFSKSLEGRVPARLLGNRDPAAHGALKIVALNAATGLESPIVFLCGIDSLFEQEDRIGLDASEREELIRDNTRRIYMGMTRACQRLVVAYASERSRNYFREDLLMASPQAG